jgi:hypothetical protein
MIIQFVSTHETKIVKMQGVKIWMNYGQFFAGGREKGRSVEGEKKRVNPV